VTRESWPIRGAFRIARGAKREAEIVVAEVATQGHIGRGEAVPYPRYGESVESVLAQCAAVPPDVTRDILQQILPAGAARNAVDCALLDLEAKITGRRAQEILGLPPPRAARTAFTLSLDTPEEMGKAAGAAAAKGYALLKLKVAGAGDVERVAAVRAAAPRARLIVDANEGWTANDLVLIPALAGLGVALIEQPLPAGEDEALKHLESPVPICADESCHTRADLPRLAGRYSHINVKLDKAGGLTEAASLAREAKARGFGIMIGCMVATSLAMAPATFLAPLADFVDLDGPLLLEKDRDPGLFYEGDLVHPSSPDLWG
jgi:L-alanine-DL-glutamate epimerase-like enolase superfamily enzyme